MARQKEDGRKLPEVTLGSCHLQSGKDRFGEEVAKILRKRSDDYLNGTHVEDSDATIHFFDGPKTESGAESGAQPRRLVIPRMQYHRNNLTALSQKYNLYITAYQGQLCVYRPRSIVKQSLPQYPDLVLSPKPSPLARHVGGHIDRHNGHQANHIITGFLGHEEILLAAYDNGDVVGYYMRELAYYVAHSPTAASDNRPPLPRQFFHSNVGSSAWGLATHAKSRLIAVTSNRHEVTVFAFGLTEVPAQLNGPSRTAAGSIEKSVLKRKRTWMIVVSLGKGASNLPNVTILDDNEGFAEKVCVIDINGTCWIADIWRPGTAPIKLPHHAVVPGTRPHPNQEFGWGILAIPDHCFLYVDSWEDFLGLKQNGIMVISRLPTGRWVNTTPSLESVKEHPSPPIPSTPRRPEVTNAPLGMGDLLATDPEDNSEIHAEEGANGIPDNAPNNFFPANGFMQPGMDAANAVEGIFDVLHEALSVMPAANLNQAFQGDGPDIFGDEGEVGEEDEQPINNTAEFDEEDSENEEHTTVGSGQAEYGGSIDINAGVDADEGQGVVSNDENDGENGDEDNGNEDDANEDSEEEDDEEDDDEDDDEDDEVDDDEDDEVDDDDDEFGQQNFSTVDDEDDEHEDIEVDEFYPTSGINYYASSGPLHYLSPVSPPEASSALPMTQCDWLDMIYTPHDGETYEAPMHLKDRLTFLRRCHSQNRNTKAQDAAILKDISRRTMLLRTYEKDIELRRVAGNDTGVLCVNPLNFNLFDHNPRHRFTQRVNMLAVVPELSLAVLASQVGRVALLTLTRVRPGDMGEPLLTNLGLQRGFRTDWILPLKKDEVAGRKPHEPLYGMAIGPVQESGLHSELLLRGGGPQAFGLTRKYRLMLHYRDHSILTYEISRDDATRVLKVI